MNARTQETMKAIEIKGNALHLTERPVPVPGPDETLIRVQAAGINRPDILQRLGKYPPPPGMTDIPGLEVAGIREDTGEAVCALLAGGGYAEYAVAPAGQCLPVPKGLSMEEAAALPECVFTVWNNLFLRGGLKAGESALIHGGASGIGTTAIQMAKAFGARAIVTAGTEEKCNACRKLGADIAINYRTSNFANEIKKICGGVDVVLDMVGGDYVPRSIEIMNPDGRHVSIAYLNGAKAEVPIPSIMQKRLTLTGSTLRARPVEEKAALARDLKEKVWPLIEAGKIRPVIFKTFPLAEAAEAQAALEGGGHIGKIVLSLP
ncbi:MAG: NAD(P)H-quinone oxidoreductase [Proteobacteria bacterium]|nr:NAD(P)H-quinone oxidoreductase [Pseudomonadota bacterium]